MKRPYQIAGLVFVLFSVFATRESLRYPFYTEMGPGGGFFPLFISILLGLLGAIMVFQATFGEPDPMPDDFFPSRAGYLRVATVILALVGTVALLGPLGYRLTVLAFLLVLLFALGRQNLIVTGLVAVAGSFGVYYLFAKWLKVHLPVGIFGI